MSAIFGIVQFDGAAVATADLARMGNTLAHRGPDGRKTAITARAGFGHCLLRVNIEDWHEAQPIHDSGVMLVADARIDNRAAVAAAIGIAPDALGDMADSAVILAAWRHWGEACVDHLIGDFAFALWNAADRSLLLARDAMGQRGLYYHQNEEFIAFASEAKALWAFPGVPRTLSEAAIARQLMIVVDAVPGETAFDGIVALPGATILHIAADGAARARSYWQPRADPVHLGHDDAYYVAAYRRVLEEAVACRVRRLIRHPALLLSGGFDSGGIAALAGPIIAAQGRRLLAVTSLLAEGEKRAVRDARAAVAAFRHYPWIEVQEFVRTTETTFTDLEAHFAATDIGSGTPYVYNGLYTLAARSGARLAMDGYGGDYTLNVRPGDLLGRILLRGKPITFLREYRARMRATGVSWRRVLLQNVLPAFVPLKFWTTLAFIQRRGVPIWQTRGANPDFIRRQIERGVIDPARLRHRRPSHNRGRERWIHLLRKVSLQQPAGATLAARHGLDFTRPFHDQRVVELALAIPERLYLKDGLERWLARHALSDILPPRLLASGPGNDSFEPDMFRAMMDSAPAALAELRALDRDGRLSRYVDMDRLAAVIADSNESRLRDHARLHIATRAIIAARFIHWFERGNS
ncbi:asparagine synthase-related protein [Sphingomonas hylomeconis]|uniref:asparagine synthase (glutamine-hydrolyzing) n=1 Tax=Sphingomonas hylomeconis TaxID=1395958 RepID=A0ABV7SV89_9SPHN|nr:asparagine synthase-related protein [Sphingomonas hylomeconis]